MEDRRDQNLNRPAISPSPICPRLVRIHDQPARPELEEAQKFMSTVSIKQRMNAEEFFTWCNRPENRDRHYELERGEVVAVSRPGERHGFVCLNVGAILRNYTYQRRKGYACSNDTGVILERDPDTVRGPDVVLYDQVRRYDELNPRYSDQPPTLAVEVLSPNDQWGNVTRRIFHFLSRGIPVVWLVDPEGQTVTVYRPNQIPQVFEGQDELTGGAELYDFRCRVSEFFYLAGVVVTPMQAGPGG
jgi:Uma2 family endonuclease